VPVLEWLDKCSEKVKDKCAAKILRLQELGYKLTRPEADYLRDGIYELRIICKGTHYRILYFFSGREIVVLTYSFVKKTKRVPVKNIEKAIENKIAFMADPKAHTYSE
jgi:phage-related protein